MIEMTFVDRSGARIVYAPSDEVFSSKPLGFTDLVTAISSEEPVLEVEFKDAVIRESSVGHVPGDRVSMKHTFTHKGRVEVFGLVLGGWLPLPWAHKQVAWVDRNVIRALVKHLSKDSRPLWADGGAGLGQDVSRVSSVLYAIEGGLQRRPTFEEMNASLDEGSEVLRSVLPMWQVEAPSDEMRQALFLELERLHESAERSRELLLYAGPLVAQPVSKDKQRTIEGHILEKAKASKASRLTVFALLSCLYDNAPHVPSHKAARPGRAVLKPGELSSSSGMYNALSDLSHLELMLGAIATLPNYQPVLYTRDVGMASFWTSLAPSNPSVVAGSAAGFVAPRWDVHVTPSLFPALSQEECSELLHRLRNY